MRAKCNIGEKVSGNAVCEFEGKLAKSAALCSERRTDDPVRNFNVAPNFAASGAIQRVLRAAVRVLRHASGTAPSAAYMRDASSAPTAHKRIKAANDEPDVVIYELVKRIVAERAGAQVLLV